MKHAPEAQKETIAFDVVMKSIQSQVKLDNSELEKYLDRITTVDCRQRLLLAAVQAINVSMVRSLLVKGADPNKTLVSNPPLFESMLEFILQRIKVLHSEEPPPEFYAAQEIAQLLWIHKANKDFSKPYTPTTECIKEHQALLAAEFPDVFDFTHPALALCFAVHAALQIPQRKDGEWGRDLFIKMLNSLRTNRAQLLRCVVEELKREERAYPGDLRAPISLVADHFHCDLLREICRDQTLAELCGIDAKESAQFDHQRPVREKIRRSVVSSLQSTIIMANRSKPVEAQSVPLV